MSLQICVEMPDKWHMVMCVYTVKINSPFQCHVTMRLMAGKVKLIDKFSQVSGRLV